TVDVSYQPRVPNGAPATAYIMVLDGNVKAFAKNFQPVIYPGFVASAFGTQLNTPDSVRNGSMDTEWVHSLLVEQGKQTEETQNRAIELLSILSKQAENDPAEAALRSLGELAAPETARWLTKSFLETQVARRRAAANAPSPATARHLSRALEGTSLWFGLAGNALAYRLIRYDLGREVEKVLEPPEIFQQDGARQMPAYRDVEAELYGKLRGLGIP